MRQIRFVKFVGMVVGANVLVYLGYSLHTCPSLTAAKEADRAAPAAPPPRTPTPPPLRTPTPPSVREQSAKPGEALVFRWNGTSWQRQAGFCSGNYSFRRVTLRTPGGNTPMYVHENSQDSYVSGSLAASGTWDYNNVMLAVSRLQAHPGSMLLDLGSQLGTFSLSAAKTGRRVVAVDPLLENVLRLCKSLQDGGLTNLVTVLYVAVSDSRGVVSFNRHQGNVGGTEVIKVTRPPDPKDPNVMETVLLDDIIPFVTTNEVVVKLDVETHEYHVLSGGREFLRKFSSPDILMEWLHYRSHEDAAGPMLKLMGEHDYTAFKAEDTKTLLDPAGYKDWPDDVLWTRKTTSG